MNLFICSDLHIDFLNAEEYADFSFPEADAYLIAGDLMNGVVDSHYQWLIEKTKGVPSYISPGNHDYYGSTRDQSIARMRELVNGTNIHVVFDEAITIAPGLQLWASDFWTDMNITGSVRDVIDVSKTQWDDFDYIDIEKNGVIIPLTAEDTLLWYENTLEKFVQFSNDTQDQIIVMSHHGMFVESLVRDLNSETLSAIDGLRTSDLGEAILNLDNPPILAINGHIHNYNQQALSPRTHLFCNPRGGFGKLKPTLVSVQQENARYHVSFINPQ